MSVYCWDFEIKQLPEPPKGINQASPTPPQIGFYSKYKDS